MFASMLDQQPPEGRRLLRVAACFEGNFSIDWILELTGLKASVALKLCEHYAGLGVFEKRDVDRFSFAATASRKTILESMTDSEKKEIRGKIADLLWLENPDDEGLKDTLSGYLMQNDNNLDECRRLKEAGDVYRRKGPSGKSVECYDKVVGDLASLEGVEADTLFIETAISYSKDRSALNHPGRVISRLKEALTCAERLHDRTLHALVLLHLANNEWLMENYAAAREYYLQGEALSEGIDNPELERARLSISIYYLFSSGRFQEAIKKYERSEPVFSQKYPNHPLSRGIGIILGPAYCYLGEFSQGRGLLDTLRAYSLKIRDDFTALAATLNIALSFILLNDFMPAIRQLESSLENVAADNNYGLCAIHLYLGYCYFRTGKIAESKPCLEKALKLSLAHNYNLSYYSFLFEFAHAIEKGAFPKVSGLSLSHLIEQATNSDNIFQKGMAYRHAAIRKKRASGSSKEIVRDLMRSLALLEESGFRKEIALTRLELGSHYAAAGDAALATEHVTEAVRLLHPLQQEMVPVALRPLVKASAIQSSLLDEILDLGERVMLNRNSLEVVQTIFSTVNRITGAERAAIFLRSRDADAGLELYAAKNLTPEEVEAPGFAFSKALLQETLNAGKVLVRSDLDSENGAADSIKSLICVPMVAKRKIIGCLYHDNRVVESTVRDDDRKMLSYFASFAAIALDNARAYEEIQSLNQRLSDEKQYYELQHLESLHFSDFIAASRAMKDVLGLVERVAGTESTVLITGETGVGKEVVARSIHRLSDRGKKPFISLNCGALPENLVPSELFGHEKGAFTGAVTKNVGRFELADGGTLFLDEIGELSPEVQVRLLRVLETRTFERVGGRKTLRSDFRLLAATNRDLEKEVRAGRFRSDLYYRLNVFPILVPPLRQRQDDILPLTNYFLKIYSKKSGKRFKGIGREEASDLLSYHWPGNVRELENIVERGVILNAGGIFRIPKMGSEFADSASVRPPYPGITDDPWDEEHERRTILAALKVCRWKIYGPGGAAERLGVSRSTLYKRMKALGIKRKAKSIIGL